MTDLANAELIKNGSYINDFEQLYCTRNFQNRARRGSGWYL